MTNLSGSPEDHGPSPSKNGGQAPDSEAINGDNKMVSGMVNGGNLANGWHHFDEDSNMSMESGGSPDRKKKRKLSSDSDEAMRRSKLARILLEVCNFFLCQGWSANYIRSIFLM